MIQFVMSKARSSFTALELVESLLAGRISLDAICTRFNISSATAKRLIADARELGAKIESVRTEHGSVYELRNEADIADRLEVWLEFERAQSLTWDYLK